MGSYALLVVLAETFIWRIPQSKEENPNIWKVIVSSLSREYNTHLAINFLLNYF